MKYGFWFDTHTFRIWWSVFGLSLWALIFVFSVIDHGGWSWKLLFALEVAWMTSVFVIMGREMRDRHRDILARLRESEEIP